MLPDPLFLNVHMYGVMVAIGVLATFTVLYLYGKKLNFSEKFSDFVFYNALFSIVVGFGSAALFQSVYNYIENPDAGFHFSKSITFIGGLIGGVIFFLAVYFILKNKINGKLVQLLPLAPCAITVAHAFGRVGCFFAGCCYGIKTDSALGVVFPELGYPVHPTQLYEAAFLFVLFAVMSYLLLCRGFRHNMSVYLISYGIFRFALEFLRDDHRGALVSGITPSQFWSVCMVVIGVALIFVMKKMINDGSMAEVELESVDTDYVGETDERE